MATEQGGSPTRLRVLVADDSQEARRNMRLMLALAPDVEVVALARDGREAVELAAERLPDVAVMDVNMPHVNGIAAIRALMETHPALTCIVASAERDNQTLREAMSAGARDYLIKPFTAEELIAAVRRAGEGSAARRERLRRDVEMRREHKEALARLAAQCAQSRRTDDEAARVFEELAADPNCDQKWLMTLAMMYVVRREWGKLKGLAARLEGSGKPA
mgnify:CR=1 FL=1